MCVMIICSSTSKQAQINTCCMNGLMDTLRTGVDLKLIFWETFKKRHFTKRKMATIIGMVQILNKKDSTLTNK